MIHFKVEKFVIATLIVNLILFPEQENKVGGKNMKHGFIDYLMMPQFLKLQLGKGSCQYNKLGKT